MQDRATPYKRTLIHKSTVLWALTAIVLAVITGLVGWYAYSYSPSKPNPKVEGSLHFGLPGLTDESDSGQVLARSALVYDIDQGQIVFEQNGFERRPIASLTKLMTAMVAIDHGIDWDAQANIEPQEYVAGGQLLLHPGETVKMRDLFAASLLGSANNATLAYVRQLNIPTEEFVQEMNRKAIELGLEQTQFVDVTGLNPENVSTAYEAAKMASIAFTKYPDIAEVTSQPTYTLVASGTEREHTMKNTNKLLSEGGEAFLGSKTGFLYEAGYCLVVRGSGTHEHHIAIVLGSPTENQQFIDMKRLLSLSLP